MEYRQLGASGLQVPVLSFGTATFGGGNEFFKAWGSTQAEEAKRLIEICLDAGVNFFDTADIYSDGMAEEVLGRAIAGIQRDKLLLSTKTTFTFGEGPNNQGSSRFHILKQIEGSLNVSERTILTFTICTVLMATHLSKKPFVPLMT